jgi:transcriptional regulator with XRE-family HTH domain
MIQNIEDLGKAIRERRVDLRLSQKALAEKVGTMQGHLGAWERGEVAPTITSLLRLSAELGSFTIGGNSATPKAPVEGGSL